MTEKVRPSHYKANNGSELMDIIAELEFWRSNIIKYVFRAGRKENEQEIVDLKKARWYLEWRINQIENAEE